MTVGIDNITPGTSTSSSLSLGSMRAYLQDLILGLPAHFPQWHFKVFTPVWNEPFLISHSNVEVVLCRGALRARPARVLFEQVWLPSLIRREKIDLWLGTCNYLPLAIRCRSLLLVHSHQFYTNPEAYGWLRGAFLRLIVRLSLHKADLAGAQSADARQKLVRFTGAPESKIQVIYNRPGNLGGTFAVGERTGVDEIRRPYLLYVSGLYPFKNHQRLIQAFAAVRPEFPGLALVLAGGGDDSGLRALARSLGVEGDIIFYGRAAVGALRRLYLHAAASVFPSLEETFGLSVLEAMSLDCPVLTSDQSSMAEIAGDAALLVNPESCGAIADGLRRILTDDALRSDLIGRGRVRCALFTRENTISGVAAALSGIH